MLGSVHDAEDALQETPLRAWRALARFEGRSSLRSWLYTIATNTCLNAIEKRPKRVLPIDYGPAHDPHDGVFEPLVEAVWVEPYPDDALGIQDGLTAPEAAIEQRESVELAFVAALQMLPGNQRAALILREVLGFSAAETAEALETTVRGSQQRPPEGAQAARRAGARAQPADDAALARRRAGARDRLDYATALERGDTEAVLGNGHRGHGLDDAPDADLVPRTRGDQDLLETVLTPGVAASGHAFERPTGDRRLHLERRSEVYGGFGIDGLTLRENGSISGGRCLPRRVVDEAVRLPEDLPAGTEPTEPTD